MGIDGQVVIFNVKETVKGNQSTGIELYYEVLDLHLPLILDSRKPEVLGFIREGLVDHAFFRPFADGGTIANPNTVARWDYVSVTVEFQ